MAPIKTIAIGSAATTVFVGYVHDALNRSFLLSTFFKLFFGQIFIYMIYAIFLYPFYFSPLRHLPTPKGNHWLFGHAPRIVKEPNGAPTRDWIVSVPNDGLLRYFWFFNIERVVVVSPQAMAEVLVTKNYTFPKPSRVRESIARVLGFGVLLAEGDEHKLQRRNLMPAFAFRHVKDLYPTFWRKTREVVQAMTAAADEKGVLETEVYGWSSRATLDIIGLAGMGKDFGAIHDEENELVKTYTRLFKPSGAARVLALLSAFVPQWILQTLPIEQNDQTALAAKKIRSVCMDLIADKKAKMAAKEAQDLDILSVALESGLFSDDGLVDQMMTFLAAGHETTASAMIWAIYLMALHKDVQTKLRQEVRSKLPSVDDGDTQISSLDIDKMPYLNAVCNEVLRFYSPVPQTLREAAHNTTILDQPIPKGTNVFICAWGTNRDPKLWGESATRFDPERWLSTTDNGAASGGAASNYAFLTFLHGPRSCIGQSFAKAEFACLLAGWIGRFEFDLQEGQEKEESKMDIKGGVTAKPSGGMNVRATVLEGY